MSMRDYAVDDYGLVLFSNDLRLLAEKIVDDFSECDWENDMYSIIEDVVGKLGIEYISSFTGETYQLLDDGDVDWADSDLFNDERRNKNFYHCRSNQSVRERSCLFFCKYLKICTNE